MENIFRRYNLIASIGPHEDQTILLMDADVFKLELRLLRVASSFLTVWR